MDRPVILDIDRSVTGPAHATRIDLSRWHSTIRFGCSLGQYRRFADDLSCALPDQHGPVLLGSGDFHHISRALIARRREHGLRVIVFDNHPDNMRFPFGIHCGSWVRDVASMPHVSHVHMIGMTSSDMGGWHAWEHRLLPLIRHKLTYWTLGKSPRWMRRIGLGHACRHFDSPDSLVDAFETAFSGQPHTPTYVSIDKDVVHRDEIYTNWDQGILSKAQLCRAIQALQGHVVAADITGELSHVSYPQRWKRWLSALDGQTAPENGPAFEAHQIRQSLCNQTLLETLHQARVRA